MREQLPEPLSSDDSKQSQLINSSIFLRLDTPMLEQYEYHGMLTTTGFSIQPDSIQPYIYATCAFLLRDKPSNSEDDSEDIQN